MKIFRALLFTMAPPLLYLPSSSVNAHPGGLAADGCHYDRSSGERHCHRKADADRVMAPKADYYPNCAAARAAGAAPLRRGDRGYRAGLDRDNDGIACE